MKSVLVVDDSFLQRKIIKNILEKQREVEVTEGANGQDALNKLGDASYDVMILDLLMPVLSGIDTLKGLKEKNIEIPVIICSADIQDATRKECEELGVFGFINKPPQPDEL